MRLSLKEPAAPEGRSRRGGQRDHQRLLCPSEAGPPEAVRGQGHTGIREEPRETPGTRGPEQASALPGQCRGTGATAPPAPPGSPRPGTREPSHQEGVSWREQVPRLQGRVTCRGCSDGQGRGGGSFCKQTPGGNEPLEHVHAGAASGGQASGIPYNRPFSSYQRHLPGREALNPLSTTAGWGTWEQ